MIEPRNSDSNTTAKLENFIDNAVARRQYSASTAAGLKVALRLYAKVFNEPEQQSITTVKANLDRLDQAVLVNNQTTYTSGTLEVYRKRFAKVINDYLDYQTTAHEKQMSHNLETVRIEWPLAHGRQAVLYLPADLTGAEAGLVKQLIDLQNRQ